MDQRHVATCANHCWQQLPWHARHVGDDEDDDDDGDDDDCVAPVMGNETDMDVDVGCGMWNANVPYGRDGAWHCRVGERGHG